MHAHAVLLLTTVPAQLGTATTPHPTLVPAALALLIQADAAAQLNQTAVLLPIHSLALLPVPIQVEAEAIAVVEAEEVVALAVAEVAAVVAEVEAEEVVDKPHSLSNK